MRVITGKARGKVLKTLPGEELRPTAARVKEGLFSAIQFDIEGRRVLDLFAGSGQLGIEALSRGAEHAVFIDESADAVNCINANLRNTGLQASAEVRRGDYASYLFATQEVFDIVFIDPPYRNGLYDNAMELAAKKLSDHGMMICEYPSDVAIPETVGDFKVSRSYRYGKVNVSILRKDGGAE